MTLLYGPSELPAPSELPGPVLVRCPSWLGDFVAVEPALRALVRTLGSERLTFVGERRFLELLSEGARAARSISPTGDAGKDALAWRGHRAAILFTGSFRSAWAARRAGIAIRVGVIRDGRGPLLTHGHRPSLERGGLARGRGVRGRWPRVLPRSPGSDAIELLGSVGVSVVDVRPRLADRPPSPDLERWLDGRAPFVLLQVGGREGSAKAWDPESWVDLGRRLAALGGPELALVAGPGEESRLDAVARGLGAQGVPFSRAFDHRPADLEELLGVCRRAACVVTTDTGPRHLARAAGTPTVTLFGPTDPRHTLLAEAPEVRLGVDVECGPCHLERCPIPGDGALACFRGIGTEAVADAVLRALGSPS